MIRANGSAGDSQLNRDRRVKGAALLVDATDRLDKACLDLVVGASLQGAVANLPPAAVLARLAELTAKDLTIGGSRSPARGLLIGACLQVLSTVIDDAAKLGMDDVAAEFWRLYQEGEAVLPSTMAQLRGPWEDGV